MTVYVQRPGELPEAWESFAFADMAEACRRMLARSEPAWRVWIADAADAVAIAA